MGRIGVFQVNRGVLLAMLFVYRSVATSKVTRDVDGYNCSGKTTKVFFPTNHGDGPWPVVLFAHGTHGYPMFEEGYDKWLYKVASHGLVVIAPATEGAADGGQCESDRDLLVALSYAKKELNVEGVTFDFERLGVIGHSLGARDLTSDVILATPHVLAAVLSHGGWDTDQLTVPSFFMEADQDEHVPPDSFLSRFEKCPAEQKVYVNLKSGGHTEPSDDGQLSDWTGVFLACHLKDRQDYCDQIYKKSSQSLCESVSAVPDQCIVIPEPSRRLGDAGLAGRESSSARQFFV